MYVYFYFCELFCFVFHSFPPTRFIPPDSTLMLHPCWWWHISALHSVDSPKLRFSHLFVPWLLQCISCYSQLQAWAAIIPAGTPRSHPVQVTTVPIRLPPTLSSQYPRHPYVYNIPFIPICLLIIYYLTLSRHYEPLMGQEVFIHWHTVTSQKTWIYSSTAVRTSYLKLQINLWQSLKPVIVY
jgi:hypothetical protein